MNETESTHKAAADLKPFEIDLNLDLHDITSLQDLNKESKRVASA